MQRDPGPVLRDMLRAIGKARSINRGRTPTDLPAYSDDRMIAERAIEILSEASRRLPPELLERHPEIAWTALARIGNHIRHGYDRVEEAILLSILESDLDPLEAAVRAELARIGQG